MVTPNQTFITIETQGLDQAIQAARKLQPQGGLTDAVINDGLREIGRILVPSKGTGPLANETPKRSGKLANSTFFELQTGQLGGFGVKQQTLVVKQPAQTPPEYGSEFYGGFVRGGTKAHKIRARLKKVLRFEGGDGGIHFATEVNHPGTKANRYHERVLAQYRVAIQGVVGRMVQRITSQFRTGI